MDRIRHAAKLEIVRVTIRDFSVIGCTQNQLRGSLRTNRAWEALNNAWQVAVGYERSLAGIRRRN
jgi:hypothetical protein